MLLAWQWLLCMVGMVAGIHTEFPNPLKEFRLCGRRNSSFVCDPEFLLDIGDVEKLDFLAQEFRKTTTCLCSRCETGTSLGIFIRRNITQESARLYPTGKSVAEMLRKRWHLGKCNDDILIVLLTDMNISDYSMGSAVREIFPDETAKKIMRECNAHFLYGWYYQGLESVVSSFSDVLIRLQKKKKEIDKSLITGISLGIGVLLILLITAVIVKRRQHKRRKSGCSTIYASVPTQNMHNKYAREKVNEYQLEKMHKLATSDEEEEGYMSDEDTNVNTQSRQLLQIKRQLSAVTEEESDENERNVSFNNSLSNSAGGRPLQVTEL